MGSKNKKHLNNVFFGKFYWMWELEPTGGDISFNKGYKLYYDEPAFEIFARRGENSGQEIGLAELKTLAALWKKGTDCIEKAHAYIPEAAFERYKRELVIAKFLQYTWQSAVNVESFLRLRNRILDSSYTYALRKGFKKENLSDLNKMTMLAKLELKIATQSLDLIKNVDFLNLYYRLDVSVHPLEDMIRAKIEQVKELIKIDLPLWHEQLSAF